MWLLFLYKLVLVELGENSVTFVVLGKETYTLRVNQNLELTQWSKDDDYFRINYMDERNIFMLDDTNK